MLTIHHLANSQSERVVWLCEELGLEYDLVRYEREPTMLAPPAYKALHPAGTAPIITDGGVTLAETGAVFDYILAVHGEGKLVEPAGSTNYADYLFWYHFANGSMMPALITGMVLASLAVGESNSFSQGVVARADAGYLMLEARLAKAAYLAGDRFSAADIMNLFALTTLAAFSGLDLGLFPHLRDYVTRMQARAAYRAAMTRAEPNRRL